MLDKITHIIKPKLVPNIEVVTYIEYFMISAISSILLIRFFLSITGYPQLGGGGLHIAHMLWGGLLMLFAILLSLAFINADTKVYTSVMGGIGFGVFIDELGKFITSDNNYFYQPTIALIYIIFIFLFMLAKWFSTKNDYARNTYAANAVDMLKEVVIADFNHIEKQKAIQYLKKLDHHDAIVKKITQLIRQTPTTHNKFSPYQHFKLVFLKYVKRVIRGHKISKLLLTMFMLSTLLNFFLALVMLGFIKSFPIPAFRYGHLLSIFIVGIYVLKAVYYFQKKYHLKMYQSLINASLVSIFITQFFLFLDNQLRALINLGFYLSVYAALRLANSDNEVKN